MYSGTVTTGVFVGDVAVPVAGAEAAGVAADGACANEKLVAGAVVVAGALLVVFPPKLKPPVAEAVAGAVVFACAPDVAEALAPPKLNPVVAGAGAAGDGPGAVVAAVPGAPVVAVAGAFAGAPNENPPAAGAPKAAVDALPPFVFPPGAAAGAPKLNAMVKAPHRFLCAAKMLRRTTGDGKTSLVCQTQNDREEDCNQEASWQARGTLIIKIMVSCRFMLAKDQRSY